MNLTPEEIKANYDLHLKIINNYLNPSRASKVLEMIKDLGEEDYITLPASGREWHHGAYPGGYIVHVNTVVRTLFTLHKDYVRLGGTVDFTTEEMAFAALFHDLGKVGDTGVPGYLPQESNWHRVNMKQTYVPNPDLCYMDIPDRSLYLLQKYEIPVTQNEYLAIKLHDGLFDEANKSYYVSYTESSRLRTNLVPLLHTADYLASRIEFDKERKSE